YRQVPLDHVARFWLPVVLEQVVPLRTVSVSGYCATDTSPNGQVAAFKGASGSRVIVDLETSEVLLRMDGVPDAAHMAFSERSERVLVARGTHGTVWDVQAGVIIRTLELPERHFSFKFSLGGSRLLVNADTSAVVWDLETGEQVGTF